jgi:hypothetical protein
MAVIHLFFFAGSVLPFVTANPRLILMYLKLQRSPGNSVPPLYLR